MILKLLSSFFFFFFFSFTSLGIVCALFFVLYGVILLCVPCSLCYMESSYCGVLLCVYVKTVVVYLYFVLYMFIFPF